MSPTAAAKAFYKTVVQRASAKSHSPVLRFSGIFLCQAPLFGLRDIQILPVAWKPLAISLTLVD
jgi:hypothetical protein